MSDSPESLQGREQSSATIAQHSQILSRQLKALRQELYPPEARKSLRYFAPKEAAALIGIAESTLRAMTADGESGPSFRLENGRRLYSLEHINEIRSYLANRRPQEAADLLPRRRANEHLQVLVVANFKGGSAKTTTSIHLAHYLAMQGLRVLAVDLDPQASLTSLFGIQPEFDVGDLETLYAAMRYSEPVRLEEVIRETYFPGLHLVPGNLELMEFEHETPQAILEGTARGDDIFFRRMSAVLKQVEDRYDVVVVDAPPQLGYLTLSALFAATALIITVHPAMLDLASMNQFLNMTKELIGVLEKRGGQLQHDFVRYLLTRHNPNDIPQVRVAATMRALFKHYVLTTPVLETTAIANAGLEKKSLYEIERGMVNRDTMKRALESVDGVNAEIYNLMKAAWGRR